MIDPGSNTLYVVVYTQDPSGPAYRIHALDLGSLTDKVTPQVITASHTLTDGTTFTFNATYQRQRPGLLLANGNIYAGFGSFCDLGANLSRGWLLGWTNGIGDRLAANRRDDIQATSPNNFFLSAIWMSGYGLAADDAGNILFVTGNSDYSGTTYDGVTNIQESVVKVSSSASPRSSICSRPTTNLNSISRTPTSARVEFWFSRSAWIDAASGGRGGQGWDHVFHERRQAGRVLENR